MRQNRIDRGKFNSNILGILYSESKDCPNVQGFLLDKSILIGAKLIRKKKDAMKKGFKRTSYCFPIKLRRLIMHFVHQISYYLYYPLEPLIQVQKVQGNF